MRTHPIYWMMGLVGCWNLGCSDLTAPVPEREVARVGGGHAAAPKPAAAPGGEAERPARPADPNPAARGPRIGASHVLIAYKGSRLARPEIARSKEQAKQLAEDIMRRAKKGEDFGSLAQEHSDEPRAEQTKGSLGTFERHSMVKPFADAAFALKAGEISEVVETDFGFHVIKRTE